MGAPREPGIVIAGRSTLAGELVASEIETRFALPCRLQEELPADDTALVLVDACDAESTERLLETNREPPVAALFGVGPQDEELACRAVRRGVRGIFLATDSLSSFLDGIRMLLNGDPWIPQSILLKAATDRAREEDAAGGANGSSAGGANGSSAGGAGRSSAGGAAAVLTVREAQVLAHVGAGRTNGEIAALLSVSPHTVKSHIYNIYRKIGVGRRFAACLWAARHLGLGTADTTSAAGAGDPSGPASEAARAAS